MKIAIYGGAFNPPHNGHLNLALSLNKKYHFDKIILIPTGNPPHKSDNEFAPATDRLEMCRRFSKIDAIFVSSDIEILSDEKSYTYFTVMKLKKNYPNDDFYLIIGGDMLRIFDKWYEYRKLSKEVKIICGARTDDYSELVTIQSKLKNYGCNVSVEKIDFFDISSTEIREKLKYHQTVNKLLPESIIEYISERQLYEN